MVTEFLDTEKSLVVIDHRRLQAFNCCVSYIISKPAINQKKKKTVFNIRKFIFSTCSRNSLINLHVLLFKCYLVMKLNVYYIDDKPI